MALIYVILYTPIIVLMLISFNSSASTASVDGFSFRWYGELFSRSDVFEALKNSLLIATLSAVISTLLGTAAAVGMSKMRSRAMKRTVDAINNIPMMNPEIVVGISMMLFFVAVFAMFGDAMTLGFGTVLIAHITFNLPYVILNVTPKLRQLDKHLSEAALDLGCTPVQSFIKVELPNIISGVVSGFIMAFTLSLDDFVITYFVSGAEFQTLPVLIYNITKKPVKPDIYALFTLLILTIFVLLIISNVISARGDRKLKGGKGAK